VFIGHGSNVRCAIAYAYIKMSQNLAENCIVPALMCHPIVIRLQRTGCLASLSSAPILFGNALGAIRLPQSPVGLHLRRRYQAPLCRVSAPHLLCLRTTFPGARALGVSFSSTIGLSMCLRSSCLKRGLQGAGLAVGGPPYPVNSFSRSYWGCGSVRLHGSTPSYCCLCDGYKCSHEHQCSSYYRCVSPTPGQSCVGSSTWQTRCGPSPFRCAWHAFGLVGPWLLSLRSRGWGPIGACGG
jgi:hypothetical protein